MNPSGRSPDIRKRCFAPVNNKRTRLLISGTLPGDKSLTVQEYYGNRENKFWDMVGTVIGADLRGMAYDARLATLLSHGIGLWDIVTEAHRQGSLDSNIKERNDNDLLGLLKRYPGIKALEFSGGTAGELGMKVLGARASAYQVVKLPSSSPAYTLSYVEKAMRWQAMQSIVADT
ncbi:DNA-deoxyinosine glycosylase [Massilia sp. CT11-108]|uniref:DNA-deoxyinosine glycosylase n=1 Tax=Massilia sp. CT11-108 TaxID=3393900 RepID=UPI0039A54E4D